MVTVDLLIARASGRWALLTGNRMIGSGPHLPSPSQLAGLVLADHHDCRSAVTATCRGPVARPTHLW